MPKIDDIAYLIETIGRKDYQRARAWVKAMVDTERKKGRESAAQRLEQSLQNWTNEKLTELPQNIQPLVWPEEPKISLSDLYLESSVINAAHSFLLERVNLEALSEAGLTPRNRILLAGPPGNGKTSLAEALAKELDLPFLSIKLHETIEGHMGETSANLGRIFEYAQFNNCLVFLDELDCLGSQRISGAENVDRERNSIVNSLLTNIDRLPSESIIIGATNLPESIDGALERRFNLKLWLDCPSDEQIKLFIADYQQTNDVVFPDTLGDLSGRPWSRVAEFCLNHHRCLILGEENVCNDEWIGGKKNA